MATIIVLKLFISMTLGTPTSRNWKSIDLPRSSVSRGNLQMLSTLAVGQGTSFIKFLGDLKTVGVDVEQTCRWLRRKYPGRSWIEPSRDGNTAYPVDLVIASDVIEHLVNPDELMASISGLGLRRFIILSTPDRNLLRAGTHDGPPGNPAHVREWSFVEFGVYVKEYFEIVEHFISCAPQATLSGFSAVQRIRSLRLEIHQQSLEEFGQ